eukprot:SAG31_NODE_10666_length_1112_cov_0.931885_2_plen_79_part_01
MLGVYDSQLARDFANLHAPSAQPQQVDLGVFGRGAAIMDQDLNYYPLAKRVHGEDGSFVDQTIGSTLGRPNALTEKIIG